MSHDEIESGIIFDTEIKANDVKNRGNLENNEDSAENLDQNCSIFDKKGKNS